MYNYFIQNNQNYSIEVLKNQALKSGYSQIEINEVLSVINSQKNIVTQTNNQTESIMFGFQANSGNIACGLYFTNNRIIASRFKGSFGLCFFLGYIGELICNLKNQKKFRTNLQLTPQNLYMSNNQNLQIPVSSITNIKMRKPSIFSPGQMMIKGHRDYKFSFTYKTQFFQALEALKQSFPSLINVL